MDERRKCDRFFLIFVVVVFEIVCIFRACYCKFVYRKQVIQKLINLNKAAHRIRYQQVKYGEHNDFV